MNFGEAIEALKDGGYVARQGWNGQFLYLLDDIEKFEPCIAMLTVQGRHHPGWLASQADMLSEDWARVLSE